MNEDFFVEFAAVARRSRGGFEPNADVFLSADGETLYVDVEIAGTETSELRVVIEARRLHIMGRRLDRARAQRGSVLLKEIAYGEFAKQIELPVTVAYDDATASYRDGMLTIALPCSDHFYLPTSRTEIRMTLRRIPV